MIDSDSESPPKRRRTELRDMSPLPDDIDFRELPKRCVERPCPLVCINQDIVRAAFANADQIDAIRPIYEDREFEELAQKNSNVLSYRRSMSVGPRLA